MRIIIDLHTHSYYSDGALSPRVIVCRAINAGCNYLSLTDHDSVEGIEEAEKFAKTRNINFIKGVEISAKYNSQSIHIVGLGIDSNEKILLDGLQRNNQVRIERAKKISDGLRKVGIHGAYEKARVLSKTDYLTRTHFAQMLVKEEVCHNISSVFKRYMTGKKPGSVSVEWSSTIDVIKWIHQAGGIAVLAHPYRYKMSLTKLRKLVRDLKMEGLDGIEILNSFSKSKDIAIAKKIADENKLLYSCGSDFHGWPNQTIELGNIPKYDLGVNSVINFL